MLFFIEDKTKSRVEEIGNLIYRERMPIELYAKGPGDEEYKLFPRGTEWGGKDVTIWLRCEEVLIPDEWKGKKVALYLNITDYNVQGVNPESLIYINGQPLQGCDKNHREIVIPEQFINNGKFRLDIKAFSGFRNYTNRYISAELVTIEDRAEKLYFLMKAAARTAETFEKDDYMHDSIYAEIDKSLNAIDWREYGRESNYVSMDDAFEILKSGLGKLGGNFSRPEVVCVGHSHIDVAWYWMLKHTREKCSRTFSTVLNLMGQYPDYCYFQSQAQLYKFIKNDYPHIYERVKEKVKEGRWEANGGMWVEADCNISSGESLVRQLLFGTRFFRDEFGVESRTVWLPDSFGFNANLPQILKKSGMKYFVTTKIGWNQFNRPPYDTFLWKGLDGSGVLANVMTMPEHPDDESAWEYTYNSEVSPRAIKRMWKNYRHIDINNQELLMTIGHGDGGGGTTREMIEFVHNTNLMPSGPVCKMGKVEDYMERLDERVKDNPHLPVWNGELYLEKHRGTYTSQAKNKRYNRKLEYYLHDIEAIFSFAGFHDYPQKDINNLWEIVLLNQFHDILPGSSIREVYEDSLKQYEHAAKEAQKIKSVGLDRLFSNILIDRDCVAVFNSLSWNRSSYIYIRKKDNIIFMDGDRTLDSQLVYINNEEYYMVFVENVPSYGYKLLTIKLYDRLSQKNGILVTKNHMENKFFKVAFNEKGQIESIFDKTSNREVLEKDKAGNVLTAYEDKPVNFDAWDIDIFYKDKGYVVDELEQIEVLEQGPERGTLKLAWNYMSSKITQFVHLYNRIPRIDFETEIQWNEKQTLLKTAFPVDVRNSKAVYDIQFGTCERSAHSNTPWDYAEFEVPAQKWGDLSQRDFGVSILNDCKYGHSIKGNVIELTLLKSAIVPDPFADKCLHYFTYSIYPHRGDWYEGGTMHQAYDLNVPLIAAYRKPCAGRLPSDSSFVTCSMENVIIETVKKAEDSDALVVRAYEYSGAGCSGQICFKDSIKGASDCDMMERNKKPVSHNGNSIDISFKPYELKCFKIEFK